MGNVCSRLPSLSSRFAAFIAAIDELPIARAAEAAARKAGGDGATMRDQRDSRRRRSNDGYPPKSSSPPKPENATLIPCPERRATQRRC